MSDLATPIDQALQEASELGRTALETALDRFAPDVREAFWNAIALYYSTRRHLGPGDPGKDLGREAISL